MAPPSCLVTAILRYALVSTSLSSVLFALTKEGWIPSLLSIQYCGSLPSFDVGASHRLRLKEKLQENPSPFELVVDPYKEQGLRYLCLKADMADQPDPLDRHSDDEDYTLYSEEDQPGAPVEF